MHPALDPRPPLPACLKGTWGLCTGRLECRNFENRCPRPRWEGGGKQCRRAGQPRDAALTAQPQLWAPEGGRYSRGQRGLKLDLALTISGARGYKADGDVETSYRTQQTSPAQLHVDCGTPRQKRGGGTNEPIGKEPEQRNVQSAARNGPNGETPNPDTVSTFQDRVLGQRSRA